MDYIKEAKKLGFSNTAIMDTKKLVFKPEYRKFCEENQRIVLYLPEGKLLTAKGDKSSASNQNLLKRHEHDLFQWGIHLCRSGNYCS